MPSNSSNQEGLKIFIVQLSQRNYQNKGKNRMKIYKKTKTLTQGLFVMPTVRDGKRRFVEDASYSLSHLLLMNQFLTHFNSFLLLNQTIFFGQSPAENNTVILLDVNTFWSNLLRPCFPIARQLEASPRIENGLLTFHTKCPGAAECQTVSCRKILSCTLL